MTQNVELSMTVRMIKELGTTRNKVVLTYLSALARNLEGAAGVNNECQSRHLVFLPRLKPGHVHNTSQRGHRLMEVKNETRFESNRLFTAEEI